MNTRQKIKRLGLEYPIRKEWVGRRRLQDEFDLTRSEAVELIEEIRQEEATLTEIENYEYDEQSDVYTFWGTDPLGESGAWKVSGEKIRNLKKDYVAGLTRKEVSRKYGLAFTQFEELRKTLDLTHNDIPATREQLDEDLDEVAEEIVRDQKEHELEKKIQRKEQRELKRDAQKWRELYRSLREVHEDAEGRGLKDEVIKPTFSSERSAQSALVLNIQDIHLGRRSEPLEDFKSRIVEGVEEIIADGRQYGEIEKIYITSGGDLLNIDNAQEATTKGTQQENITDSQRLMAEGQELMVRLVNVCRAGTKEVEIVPVLDGNHDLVLSAAVTTFLEAYYRQNEDTVLKYQNFEPVQFRTWRNALLTFDHGKNISKSDIPKVIMGRARDQLGDTKWTICYRGHYHSPEIYVDTSGTQIQTAPSPAREGNWGKRQGYGQYRHSLRGHIIEADRPKDLVTTVPV